MKKILLHIFMSFALFTVFVVPVFADGVGVQNTGALNQIKDKAGITQGDVGTIAGTVISGILSLVGVIFLILMVYAGIIWMTARGDDSKTENAKKTITASVIGLFIVVSAYAITKFVTSKINQ